MKKPELPFLRMFRGKKYGVALMVMPWTLDVSLGLSIHIGTTAKSRWVLAVGAFLLRWLVSVDVYRIGRETE